MALLAGLGMINAADAGKWKKRNNIRIHNIIRATDLNNISNPTVQPQDPVLSGGGRDQTLQLGDVLCRTQNDDLIIGKLGTDLHFGYHGDDIIIGGTENFNPFNRDRTFGGRGNDIFM
ncbi:MAG: hypothetical protein ACPGYT_01245 [Nitrospirales bacterium]